MFHHAALDVVIGLVFIYLLYSLLASILQELLATQLAFRSKMLVKAIVRMLEDAKPETGNPLTDRLKGYWMLFTRSSPLRNQPFSKVFFEHPLMKYMGEDRFYSKPSYLSAGNFSRILVDLLQGSAAADSTSLSHTLKEGRVIIPNASESPVQIPGDTVFFLQTLLSEAKGNPEKFRQLVEQWYNDTMERVTGWYRRYTRFILFLIGLGIAVAFNVDSIRMAENLSRDPALREQMVQAANTYLEKNRQLTPALQEMEKMNDTGKMYQQQKAAWETAHLQTDTLLRASRKLMETDLKNAQSLMGFGYDCHHPALLHVFFFLYPDVSFTGFIGWLLTALAISLGAPFWFDLLNKLMRIRGKSGDQGNNTKVPDPVNITIQNTNPGIEEAVG